MGPSESTNVSPLLDLAVRDGAILAGIGQGGARSRDRPSPIVRKVRAFDEGAEQHFA
jgi:hypothetical protein